MMWSRTVTKYIFLFSCRTSVVHRCGRGRPGEAAAVVPPRELGEGDRLGDMPVVAASRSRSKTSCLRARSSSGAARRPGWWRPGSRRCASSARGSSHPARRRPPACRPARLDDRGLEAGGVDALLQALSRGAGVEGDVERSLDTSGSGASSRGARRPRASRDRNRRRTPSPRECAEHARDERSDDAEADHEAGLAERGTTNPTPAVTASRGCSRAWRAPRRRPAARRRGRRSGRRRAPGAGAAGARGALRGPHRR
jgi:hypothetical protein